MVIKDRIRAATRGKAKGRGGKRMPVVKSKAKPQVRRRLVLTNKNAAVPANEADQDVIVIDDDEEGELEL